MGWHDTRYDPRVDGYASEDDPGAGYVTPDPIDQWHDEKKKYPRGEAPPWEGEDAPSDSGWGDIYTDEDDEPQDTPDPGFSEEEHRVGAILPQSQQYALRFASGCACGGSCASCGGHYEDYDHALNDAEHQESHERAR